jgi:hypothetical protein
MTKRTRCTDRLRPVPFSATLTITNVDSFVQRPPSWNWAWEIGHELPSSDGSRDIRILRQVALSSISRLAMTTIRASSAIALGFVLFVAAPTTLLANGDNFFDSFKMPSEPEYVVFGNIKDEAGRYLGNVTVMIEVSDPKLNYYASTDELGYFRTPDIGRAVKDLGYEMDASKVTIEAQLQGHHTIRKFYRGKFGQNKGAVELNITMAKN